MGKPTFDNSYSEAVVQRWAAVLDYELSDEGIKP
jgi:hypothetical protein